MSSNNGKAIAIPYGNGNAQYTEKTGDAPLLCEACESTFNQKFDGPMTNALKELDNGIILNGFGSQINFSTNQLAHAIVATGWRICLSPATMYERAVINVIDIQRLDKILRSPTDQILRQCTVKISRLADKNSEVSGAFQQNLARQFIKTPEVYSFLNKGNKRENRFAIDWTMFGFLIHLVVPKLRYPESQRFGGLKLGANLVQAPPTEMLNYKPLRDALIAGFATLEERRLTPSLKKKFPAKN